MVGDIGLVGSMTSNCMAISLVSVGWSLVGTEIDWMLVVSGEVGVPGRFGAIVSNLSVSVFSLP